ncbi:MAG TPA: hypothetical protein VK171_07170 [Fimbriimonas sp.]|nr:hypothetical protein [Fimbriimonas sp.]
MSCAFAGTTTIKLPVPTAEDLKSTVVQGFILVKYKVPVAEAIALEAASGKKVTKETANLGLTFQSRLAGSGWIMYKIPGVVKAEEYVGYVKRNDPRAITVENVRTIRTITKFRWRSRGRRRR